ncbi:hypothetical protein NP493_222g02001 [Ridgeia piscesae]|uniref:Protein RFT1 homolog n=1 Tax=Ridgeia piscesae TaxID=27915 RepID=A0AAD9UDY7_RIDPI|nr:hypothetical protein NP493_222g02001 [Ridgeia piscesae]
MFRLVTFMLNAFVLRYISRELLGVVNVRLTLLYSTTLFLTREAFRRACLSKTSDRRWQQVMNLLWCIIPIGVACTGAFGYLWAYALDQPGTVSHYQGAVWCYALSVFIELLAEPLWVVSQLFLFVRLKVLIEGTALTVRCVLTVLLVLLFPHWGVMTFALAQVIFTSVYTIMYYAYFIYIIQTGQVPEDFPFKTFRELLPRSIPGKPAISWGLASLVWSFLKQSLLKQLLTEGEKYVMTIFDVVSLADQGIYDVISNLGSLAARFIFLPIEDSSYFFFSQTLTRGVTSREQTKSAVELATQVLEAVLKVVIIIGVTFLVFGYAYSFLLLDLYGGSILSSGSGPALLRSYCVFVLLLAVNGITECFAFATMSKQEVDRYNLKMVVFSVLFLASSWYLTGAVGSIGFVLANCLNMLARIAHSLYHIHTYYKNSGLHPLRGMLLKLPVIVTFAAAFVITTLSEKYFCCSHGWTYKCLHIGIGGACLLVVMATVLLTEHQLVSFIMEQYRKRHKTDEKDTKTD